MVVIEGIPLQDSACVWGRGVGRRQLRQPGQTVLAVPLTAGAVAAGDIEKAIADVAPRVAAGTAGAAAVAAGGVPARAAVSAGLSDGGRRPTGKPALTGPTAWWLP
ncbi:hypothetical protein [Mycobacterium decipiens]|uniref:Uncharacterized protein n=1 Tax=Mycobacterium decipiens TaxID=1430326 RepID=A0A1X2LM84_9MYCO|nr:hypothetical protein [Mycobacterium decipiens]OSC35459.1 hypothetical protein B8W66_23430 [Mycobacterium decipiens]